MQPTPARLNRLVFYASNELSRWQNWLKLAYAIHRIVDCKHNYFHFCALVRMRTLQIDVDLLHFQSTLINWLMPLIKSWFTNTRLRRAYAHNNNLMIRILIKSFDFLLMPLATLHSQLERGLSLQFMFTFTSICVYKYIVFIYKKNVCVRQTTFLISSSAPWMPKKSLEANLHILYAENSSKRTNKQQKKWINEK